MDLQNLIESALDPIHQELCKDVFDGQKLNKQLRKMIIDNFNNWLDDDEIEIKKMCMIGSITGYQYTEFSDIDVNIVLGLSENEIKPLAKILPNGNLWKNHPVNYYLTTNDKNIMAAEAIYDLLEDKWIKKPSKDDTQVPVAYALEISKFFMDGIDLRISEYERDKKELDMLQDYLKENDIEVDKGDIQQKIVLKEEEIKADLDSIYIGHKMAKSFRKEAFEGEEADFLINIQSSHPNKSINNVVYKLLEKFGYFEKLDKYEKIRKQMKDE